MTRRKRRRQTSGRMVILVSSIIMINLLGVGYATWNDNFNMIASISTGSMEPYFVWDECREVEYFGRSMDIETYDENGMVVNDGDGMHSRSRGRITARVIDDHTVEIKGWCYPDFSKSFLVNVGNKGSIPMACNNIEAYEEDEIVEQIQYTNSNVEIDINVGNVDNGQEVQYGKHSFTYQLQLEQDTR